MMKPSITTRALAKVRFFAIYILSVLLILLLVSSFRKTEGAASGGAGTAAELKLRLSAIDALLHQRLELLETATLSWAESAGNEKAKAIDDAKTVFQTTVDSVRKANADLPNLEEKAAILRLLNTFTQAAERESRMAGALGIKGNTSVRSEGGSQGNGALEQLKKTLAQKELEIAGLQQEKQQALDEKNRAVAALQNVPAAQPTVTQRQEAGSAEWKEKYNRLKTASDKTSSQLETLKESYREVVEDNRRLITQLQNARAGKN
jgi:hypothetical protein